MNTSLQTLNDDKINNSAQIAASEQIQIEQALRKYKQYFGNLNEEIKKIHYQNINKEELFRHQIKILNDKELLDKQTIFHDNMHVQYAGDQQNGLVCIFQVLVGRLLLVIKLLNMQRNSEDQSEYIGKGSYGIVKKVDLGRQKFAIKKIKFEKTKKNYFFIPHLMDPDDKSEKREIRHAIKQYCIYKICSMFKIGPQIIFQNSYDIICYNDCIQFYMQLCEPLEKVPKTTYKYDLKLCVGTLHALNFVHKDIKPPNILFSPTLQKYVLCDFGITHTLKQKFGEKTLTYPQGSYQYASEEMKKLFHQKKQGYVNLYLNDLYSLDKTFDQLQKLEQQFSGSYERNSLSMMQQDSQQMSEQCSFKMQRQESNLSEISEVNQPSSSSSELNVDNSTSGSINFNIIKFSSQINFFQMKVIYEFLKISHPQQENLISIVNRITNYESNENIFKAVLKLTEQIFFPTHKYEKLIKNFRNCLRIFGAFSTEVSTMLQKLSTQKLIPTLRYKQVGNALILLKKYEDFKPYIKNLDILEIQRKQAVVFKNTRVKFKILKQMIKQYIRKGVLDRKTQKKLVIRGIEALNTQDLIKKQSDEIYSYLANACQMEKLQIQRTYSKKQKIQIILSAQKKYLSQDCQFEIWTPFLQQYQLLQYEEGFSRLIKKVSCMRKETQIKKNEYKIFNSYSLMMLWEISYHSRKGQNQTALLMIEQLLEFYQKHQVNQHIYIKSLDWRIKIELRLRQIQKADIHNEQSLQKKTQLLFPRIYGVQFAIYYFNKGLICLERVQFSEAIESWQKCIKNISSSISSSSYTSIIQCCLTNMAYCYQKQNQLKLVSQCLETAFYYSFRYNLFNRKETIQYLQNLIFTFLKMNQLDNNLFSYFNQLAFLKSEIVCTVKNANTQYFINYDRMKKELLKKQALIFALKSVILCLQTRLPIFQRTYLTFCDQIANIYFEEKRINLGLQYLWRYFKHHPKSDNNKQHYHKINYYISHLIQNQSNRRALRFLKNYIKNIPDEFSDDQKYAFKKISILSRELNTKDQKYYNFIWRNEIFLSQNWKNKLSELNLPFNINQFEVKIWQKKLRILRPQLPMIEN